MVVRMIDHLSGQPPLQALQRMIAKKGLAWGNDQQHAENQGQQR